MAQLAATYPEELTMGLLNGGFNAACFDKQNPFDTDHPIRDADDTPTTVSNMQGGPVPAGSCSTHRARCAR